MLTHDRDTSNADKFFVQTNAEGNSEFVNRQKSVFEKLDAVVKSTESSNVRQSVNERSKVRDVESVRKQRHDTRQFRGQESIFLRPEAPPPARFKRNVPDYLRHPKKWTKYTLSDVSAEDMSEQSNTAAAMSFLRELKASKKLPEPMDTNSDKKLISFKKPSFKKCGETSSVASSAESPSFRSSKVIMPEYVVGEKKATKKISTPKNTEQKTGKRKEIKLDHLNEDDE